MKIQSRTNEDPSFYGSEPFEIQNLTLTAIERIFFLRTIYGNTIVNGMDHYCDIQIQICTNEARVCVVQ